MPAVPSKDHVNPDCKSKRTDYPDLDIQNVGQGYSSSLGYQSLIASLTAYPFDQPSHGESIAAHMHEQFLTGDGQASLDALYMEDAAKDCEEDEFISAVSSSPSVRA